MSIQLTVVVENTSADESLAVEHGLAVHVAAGDWQLMFDTSSTPEALASNAAALLLDLSQVRGVVISHGHLDHTGGMAALLAARPGLEVYAHPEVFARRWAARPDHSMREIGWRSSAPGLASHGAVFCPVNSPDVLARGVVISGPIGGPQPKLDSFVIRRDEELVEDTFRDEVFLMIGGADGWAVLTGCCHRGLKNTLRKATFLARGQPIRTVIGGFHLGRATDEQLAEAGDALEQVNPELIYPCHCTGKPGREYLAQRFGEKVRQLHGGVRLKL